MAETGSEIPKITAKDRIREAFTPKGAKEKWYRDHKEAVDQYLRVDNGLTDEQRAQAITQIEADATKSARIALGKHWGALALGTATLAGIGLGIAKPELVKKTIGKIPLGIGDKISLGADKAHTFVRQIPQAAQILSIQAKERIVGGALKAKDLVLDAMAKAVPLNIKS
jgi:hypothetical protein